MKSVILSKWLTALLAYLLVQNVLAIEVNPEDESGLIETFHEPPQMTDMYLSDSFPPRCCQDRGLGHDGLLR